jgi:hypothetical protein
MPETSQSPKADDGEEATLLPPIKLSKDKTVADYQRKLMIARQQVAQAKKRFLVQSAREAATRERATGKVVLRMIEERRLNTATAALIREEIRATCSVREQAAFRDWRD